MTKLFLNAPRWLAIFVAVASSIGLGSITPAQAGSFKAIISDFPFSDSGIWEIQYTLADGLFDTVVSSPIPSYFSTGYNPDIEDPLSINFIPEGVTEFKWGMPDDNLQPVEFERSIVGIRSDFDLGEPILFIEILDLDHFPGWGIFNGRIQAPEGLPLSACKTQVCEGLAHVGGKRGYARLPMIHTPVDPVQSVPEPSTAVALGLVSALLLIQRKTSNAQAGAKVNQ